MKYLVDTGPLVALLDAADTHHDWALECFKTLPPPLLTCEAVIAEAWHLLGMAPPARKALAALLDHGIVRTGFAFAENEREVLRLLRKYADLPMDFADACLVRMCELNSQTRLWTTDSDFRIYKKMGRHVIALLAPWS